MSGRNVAVGNGKWPSEHIWKELIEQAQFIIALDGAGDRICADVVLGDMDSYKGTKATEIMRIEGQDDTDLAKALKQFRIDDVFGIEGGRLDHQMASFTALIETESDAILHFQEWKAQRVSKEKFSLNVKPGTIISLFAFGTVSKVTITGVKYRLLNEDLHTSTRGVHNVATEKRVKIKHSGGNLIAMWTRE